MTFKRGGGKNRLRGRQCRKAGAVVWQWVPTFKEAVPPPLGDKPKVGGSQPVGAWRDGGGGSR